MTRTLTVHGSKGAGKTPAERVELLFGKQPKFRATGNGFSCCCPAHDDTNASLSIRIGEGERVILKCFAGCDVTAILGKLGLALCDLFQPEENGDGIGTVEEAQAEAVRTVARQRGDLTGRWDYFTACGEHVGRVLRFDLPDQKDGRPDKTFRPLSLQPDGRWAIKAMAEPRPLYRLPHLVASAGVVFLPEGEKAADAIASLGLTSTTFSGGTQSLRQTDYRPLAGRAVVLLPDNDNSGQQCMERLAPMLGKLDPPATVATLRLPGLSPKGDAVEFIEARRGEGVSDRDIRAELERLAAKAPAALIPAVPAEPPLPVEPPWPEPPGAEAFYGLAGRIIRALEPTSEADPTALLIQTLIMFGSVIGRSAHFLVEGDAHHANEYVVMVGKTSKARKGTSWGRVIRLFREAEEQWAEERVQSGLSSGEGLIWAVRDPISKREKINNGKGQAPTYQDVEADPGVGDKRLLVYEPEFANVLKQTERQGNTLSTVLRQGWDGNHALRTMTKNSPARATGAHVSLIGHITADELRRYLTATESANGFGNRHLWLCVGRARLLPEGGQVDQDEWDVLRGELVEALRFAKTAGRMSRDDDARAIWREVYGPLSDGRPGLAGALLARAEAHVLRLSMLYALADHSDIIAAQHLLAALALWDYCERSVYHVFGDCLGDPLADDLLRVLRGCPDGMTRTDMMHYFGRHQSSDRIGRALGLLLQHHLARRERQETSGRPAERWFAANRQTSETPGA